MRSQPSGFVSSTVLQLLVLGAGLSWLQTSARAQADVAKKKGTVERVKVHGKSLEANLEGDSPDRDVFVYLPPSYATDTNRRYPVVYFLHGYSVPAERYWNLMTVPATADKQMDAGTVREFILVHPDAYTIYSGSMYSNSPTTGDWEAYITHDLVDYVDSHYRTIAGRDSRGLAGHSMGGYGTLRIGMKHPEVYSAIYAMSSCCLMNNPAAARPAPNRQPAAAAEGSAGGRRVAKWIANSPLAMVDQYVPNLNQYHSIMMDVGLQDGLAASNTEMDRSLTRLGVMHTFETYEGDHTNRVKERFETRVLPFFSESLKFQAEHAEPH